MWSSIPFLLGGLWLRAPAEPVVPYAAVGSDDSATIAANDNRRPAGRLRGGVLTLGLEVRWGMLRPEEDNGPSVPALAFAEAGGKLQVPGPLVRVRQGTEVRLLERRGAVGGNLLVGADLRIP